MPLYLYQWSCEDDRVSEILAQQCALFNTLEEAKQAAVEDCNTAIDLEHEVPITELEWDHDGQDFWRSSYDDGYVQLAIRRVEVES